MATKRRLLPPLVGGIEQASIVDEDEDEDAEDEDEEVDPRGLFFFALRSVTG